MGNNNAFIDVDPLGKQDVCGSLHKGVLDVENGVPTLSQEFAYWPGHILIE